jgi:hypothetical protein
LEAVERAEYSFEEFCHKGASEALVGMNIPPEEIRDYICDLLAGSRFACKES